MAYESFSTSKRKLQLLWEKNQETSHEIVKNIKVIDTSFLSINDFKRPETIVLLDNWVEPIDTNDGRRQYTISLSSFPDWAIGFTKPLFSYSLFDINNANTSEYDITKFKLLRSAFEDGTLEVGDICIDTGVQNYWWTKTDTGWNFTFAPNMFIRQVTFVSGSILSTSFVDVNIYITAKLYITNEKTYNAIQSGK